MFTSASLNGGMSDSTGEVVKRFIGQSVDSALPKILDALADKAVRAVRGTASADPNAVAQYGIYIPTNFTVSHVRVKQQQFDWIQIGTVVILAIAGVIIGFLAKMAFTAIFGALQTSRQEVRHVVSPPSLPSCLGGQDAIRASCL